MGGYQRYVKNDVRNDVALLAEDVPIVCSLTADERVMRAEEINDLFTFGNMLEKPLLVLHLLNAITKEATMTLRGRLAN